VIPNETISKVLDLIGNDGHTIYGVEEFEKFGLPDEFMERHITVHKSHKTNPKGMIFGEGGKLLTELRGVYGLDVLWGLANEVGADTEKAARKMGRGGQACELTVSIRRALKNA